MATQRTVGMTTIGILNIVFGALFSLVGMLVILGGGFMAGGGAAMGSDGTTEGEMMGSAAAAMGGFVMLVGVGALAINLLLLVSGIGVLKVASWGRTLSIAYGALGLIVYGALVIGGAVGAFTIGALAYAVVLLAMFFTPRWKVAFGSTATPIETTHTPEATSSTDSTDDETREAA